MTDFKNKWCIFTSAGDRHSINHWLGDPRKFDLIVAYYGADDRTFAWLAEVSSFAIRIKGGKFPNLKTLYDQNRSIFDQYSHVCVCDDDIVMSPAQISEMFEISERFDFWVAQPSYSPGGKWSHEITINAGSKYDYRIVNFVEVTLPIFKREKLVEFLNIYDGSLVGFGVDLWFMSVFEANRYGRFAIIDSIQVTNPNDFDKGHREIDRLQSFDKRIQRWMEVSKERGFTGYPPKVFAYCKFAKEGDAGSRSFLRAVIGKVAKAKAIASRHLRRD